MDTLLVYRRRRFLFFSSVAFLIYGPALTDVHINLCDYELRIVLYVCPELPMETNQPGQLSCSRPPQRRTIRRDLMVS